MALTILIVVALTILLGHSVHLIDANVKSEPPVYVIKDEPRVNSGSLPRQWNNQRLTIRQKSSSSAIRNAKQIFYTDEPVPYYHSYKYMGLSRGEGSFSDQYYQPLRRNHHNNELPWYSQNQEVSVFNTRRKLSSGTKGGSGRPQAKGRPRSPANKGHHSPNPVPAAYPTYLAGNPANGTASRRAPSGKKKNLVCYYGTWAVYRPDGGKYPVENIDPFLCTHIIYGFTGLSYDNLIKPLDPWNDLEDNYGKGAMKRFTNLKRINPDLKTLVAIGGWNEGSIKYSKMASDPEARSRFVQSVVEFLAKYNFDGLDLDWEYPGARGGYSYDKQNFVRLLRELHDAFKANNYLLTAAVSAGKWFIDPAYDIAQVSKYLDLINLMAYDYHGGWETKTGMNAPLFHSPKYDLKDEALLNVNWSVNYWLQMGASPEKIMLGVGSYGRSFTLDKASVNGINAPASQKGQAGPYTREPGSLGYNEICESFQRQPEAWTIVRDADYLAPYAYNDRQWVGYDDMQSLALKTQFAKSMGLGGMMMWSIETDDFLGKCHNEKYPLLNTIRRVLDGQQQPESGSGSSSTRRPASRPTSTTVRPEGEVEEEAGQEKPAPSSSTTTTTTTTRKPTTSRAVPGSTRKPSPKPSPKPPAVKPNPKPPTSPAPASSTTSSPQTGNGAGEFVCRSDGMFADPKNCRKFIRCVGSGGQLNYSIYRFDCGPGTAFNEQQKYCDHIYNVPNCNQQSNNNNRLINLSQLYYQMSEH